MRNYYVVLGISRGSDLEKIKKAYRSIAKKHHPDVSAGRESKERFMEIREAYETLSDETRRREYDEALAREGSSLRVRRVPEIVQARTSRWTEMEDRFSSFADEILEGFLPGFFDRPAHRRHEKDLFLELILSPEEAASGGLFPIDIPVVEACPECGKSGRLESFFCPRCNGYGRIHSERTFSLSMPPNVSHGTEIQLSLEDIGLHHVRLHALIKVDSDYHEHY